MREKWETYLTDMKDALRREHIEDIQSLLNMRNTWDKNENWTRNDIELLENILHSDKLIAAWMEKEKSELHQFLLEQTRGQQADEKYRRL